MSAWCKASHQRTGLVSNQDRHAPLDWSRAHASVTVCDSAECIRKAQTYVAGYTNETATYQPDEVSS